jgi:PAS domain S-box-containing protein
MHMRVIVNSLLLIPVFLDASLPHLGTPPKGSGFAYRFTAGVLMFGCVAACVRIAAISNLRKNPFPYFSGHPVNTLFFFLIMFMLVALSFGMITLTHERLFSDLESMHERFRLLYENAPLGLILFDQNLNVTSANQRFGEISGYSPEEAVGRTYTDISLPEDSATARELELGLRSGKIQITDRERPLLRRDGSTTWVRMTTRLMRDNVGNPQWGIGVFQDISEGRRAQEALRQSEEKFRATFEHAPLGIAEIDLDGGFIEANPKLLEILGYTKDEIRHLTVIDVTHPSDVEASLSCLQKVVAGETDTGVLEKRYIRRDRSFVWASTTASLTSVNGNPQYIIVAIEDITAQESGGGSQEGHRIFSLRREPRHVNRIGQSRFVQGSAGGGGGLCRAGWTLDCGSLSGSGSL